jgi:hypothetical protein
MGNDAEHPAPGGVLGVVGIGDRSVGEAEATGATSITAGGLCGDGVQAAAPSSATTTEQRRSLPDARLPRVASVDRRIVISSR